MACISSPAMMTCHSSAPGRGKRGRAISSTGSRHASPKTKRSVRNVKGGAYCRPILVAMKPEPHTLTKYHASSASKPRLLEMLELTARSAAHPVAAFFLRAVERAVRGLDHGLRRDQAVLALRHADADGDAHGIPAAPAAALALAALRLLRSVRAAQREPVGLDLAAQRFQVRHGLRGFLAGKHDGELLAAVAVGLAPAADFV